MLIIIKYKYLKSFYF